MWRLLSFRLFSMVRPLQTTRQCKDKLALDGYQIRSAQGIQRYWLLMSIAHFM